MPETKITAAKFGCREAVALIVDEEPCVAPQRVCDDHAGFEAPRLSDRYRILEYLGGGGMGTVWRVYDKYLEDEFAIKVLRPELVSDEVARQRFDREAALASQLTHANIAAIFGPGRDKSGSPYIVMRYVLGDSLADILACEGKLSTERATNIFRQICEALAHSHMKGVVHRDIKPSNIIISRTDGGGELVNIVDFGIARSVYEQVSQTQALTRAVDVFGSPSYMSPEQFLGQEATAQSDLYSAGCVLYEMLTGAPPFKDENPVKLILQHLNEQADLTIVPPKTVAVLRSCLMKVASLRARSADHVLQLLTLPGTNTLDQSLASPLLASTFCLAIVALAFADNFYNGASVLPVAIGFFWLSTCVISRLSAISNATQQRFEYGLFLSTIATVLTLFAKPFSAFSDYAIPGVLLMTIFAFSDRRAANAYHALIARQITALTMPQVSRPKRSSPGLSSFILTRFQDFGFAISLVILASMSSFMALELQAGTGNLHRFLATAFAFLVTIILRVVSVQKKIREKSLAARDPQKLLAGALKSGAVAVAAGIIFANSPIEQSIFFRQHFTSHDSSPNRLLTLAKEAIGLPDTSYGVIIKKACSENLRRSGWHGSELVTLSNQLIGSKMPMSQSDLTDAHNRKFFALANAQVKYSQMGSVLDDYLSQLESYQSSESYANYKVSPITKKAGPRKQSLQVAEYCLANGDSARTERALDIADATLQVLKTSSGLNIHAEKSFTDKARELREILADRHSH